MKSFRQYSEGLDWAKLVGYRKGKSLKGGGGRGGWTEPDSGPRAMVTWKDPKRGNKLVHSLIPPVQYKSAKDQKELHKMVDIWTEKFLKGTMGVSKWKVDYNR